MGVTTAVALGVIIAAELAVVSWCALWPLRGFLGHIVLHGGDWRELYSFALSNLDVWVLAVLKDCTLLVLLLATPAGGGRAGRRRRRRGEQRRDGGAAGAAADGPPEDAANHRAVRLSIGALCGVHSFVMLVKAAGVAVTAPEQLWPSHPPPPPGGGGGDGGGGAPHVVAVGLVYMYISIVASLLSSLVCSALGRALVSAREEAWEAERLKAEEAEAAAGGVEAGDAGGASGDPSSSAALREPLLPRAAAAAGGGKEGAAASGGGSGGGSGDGKAGGKSGGREAKPKLKQRTLLCVLRLTAVDWPLLLVAFSAGIAAALGSALIPFLTGQIIDFASIEPDRSKFRATTLRLLGVAALTGLVTGVRGGLFTVAQARLNVRLRQTLFRALLKFEVAYFDVTRTGEITSRLAADTSTVADQIGLNMNVLLRSATQAAMVLFFMFAASWRLTVVTFILVPVVISVSQVYGKVYSRLAKKVQAELAAANGVAEEVLHSVATVKAHAAQDSAEAAYSKKLTDFYRVMRAEAGLYALYAVLTTFLPHLVAAVVLFYGGNLVLAGMMSPGSLVSFMLYQQSLSSAFNMMGDVFGALTAAVGAADKVVELMNRQPAIPEAGSTVLPYLEGSLSLQDVHFAYPSRPNTTVLRGLSLDIRPGEVVALVGPSGGGKSSIVKLIERFYLPAAGRILLDGHDIGDLNPKWLRRQVALVSQEPVLYGRSIRRNIVFGLEAEDGWPSPPSEEEVVEAAKQANAHDFITSFPGGYDTEAGEKGVALSGGQKQRIAIARALVRRPRVLLLDEATSALDAHSEAVVQEALDRVMRGRTVLVIAHRLSTVQGADRIFVVAKGAVQETGTHEQLLAAGGVYAELVRRQITRPASQASLCGGSGQEGPGSGRGAASAAQPGRSSGGGGLLSTNILSLARRQLANFLAGSATDVRHSASVASLTSLGGGADGDSGGGGAAAAAASSGGGGSFSDGGAGGGGGGGGATTVAGPTGQAGPAGAKAGGGGGGAAGRG